MTGILAVDAHTWLLDQLNTIHHRRQVSLMIESGISLLTLTRTNAPFSTASIS
jgi:hypothetical protein